MQSMHSIDQVPSNQLKTMQYFYPLWRKYLYICRTTLQM